MGGCGKSKWHTWTDPSSDSTAPLAPPAQEVAWLTCVPRFMVPRGMPVGVSKAGIILSAMACALQHHKQILDAMMYPGVPMGLGSSVEGKWRQMLKEGGAHLVKKTWSPERS